MKTHATAADIDVGGSEVENGGDTFAAGDYFFRCELHPTQMEGTFVAE